MSEPSSPTPDAGPVPERPTLVHIASILHRGIPATGPGASLPPRFASLTLSDPNDDDPEGGLDIGLWPIPPHPDHPVAPLVGFRAPARWDAVGIITTGKMWHLDQPQGERTRVASVVLWDRHDACASVVGPPGGDPMCTIERPEGLVPDVLRRVLGLPTPPPSVGTGATIDVIWLERLAEGLRRRPDRPRSWAWVADRHPHRGQGPTPGPDLLALRAKVSEPATWTALRSRLHQVPLPAATCGPTGGQVLSAGQWFDDGSLARWLVGAHCSPTALLDDVVGRLAPHVADRVLEALVDVRPEASAPA